MVATFLEPNNVTRPYEWFNYMNVVTEHVFGVSLLLAIFIISFIALKRFGNSHAFVSSAFIVTILAFFMRTLNAISDTILFSCILLTCAGMVYLWLSNDT